jgi:hypothetical protein
MEARQHAIGVLSATLAALVLVVPASGASWRARGPVGTVDLAGQRALWTVGRGGGGFDLYVARSRSSDKVQSFRARVPNDANAVFLTPGLAATPSMIWLEVIKTVVEKDPQAGSSRPTNRFLSGPTDGPLSEFARCDQPTFPGRGGVAATDATLAFSRCDGSVEIRDLTGANPPAVAGSNVNLVRVAGRYVGWLEGPAAGGDRNAPEAIVVYDRLNAVETYRIPASEGPPRVHSFTLDSDGSVAFSFDPDPTDARVVSRVGWASAQEPRLHDLGLRATAGYAIKLVGGKLMLTRSLQREGVSKRVELAIGDLSGRVRVLARDTAGFNFDFDGRRVLYVKRTCHGRTVTRRLVSTFRKPQAAPTCPR